jgi:hypothetical protein
MFALALISLVTRRKRVEPGYLPTISGLTLPEILLLRP